VTALLQFEVFVDVQCVAWTYVNNIGCRHRTTRAFGDLVDLAWHHPRFIDQIVSIGNDG
jgi:hypothetical protein